MTQTGNSKLAKKGIGNDRLDIFIWALDSYYNGEISLLFNNSSYQNSLYLKQYFDFFKTDNDEWDFIYNYYFKVYGFKSHGLVDDLIISGKQAIDLPEKVIAYMNFEYRF